MTIIDDLVQRGEITEDDAEAYRARARIIRQEALKPAEFAVKYPAINEQAERVAAAYRRERSVRAAVEAGRDPASVRRPQPAPPELARARRLLRGTKTTPPLSVAELERIDPEAAAAYREMRAEMAKKRQASGEGESQQLILTVLRRQRNPLSTGEIHAKVAALAERKGVDAPSYTSLQNNVQLLLRADLIRIEHEGTNHNTDPRRYLATKDEG